MHFTKQLLICGLVLLWGCTPKTNDEEYNFSDDALIVTTLDQFILQASGNASSAAFQMVNEGYLHQGRNYESFRLWLDSIPESEHRSFFLRDVDVTINAAGTDAVVSYRLIVTDCTKEIDAPEDAPLTLEGCTKEEPILACNWTDRGRCDWFTHLKKMEGVWYLYGDQVKNGFDFNIAVDENGAWLKGTVYNPSGDIAGISLTWAETGTVSTMSKQSRSVWTLDANTAVPNALVAGTPFPWKLNAALAGSAATLYSVYFRSMMDVFATDLLPNGEAIAPFHFSWAGQQQIPGGVEVKVFNEEGVLVWASPRVYSNSVEYGGPTLLSGQSYVYEVWAYDLNGNYSIAKAIVNPMESEDISPVPVGVTPSVGGAQANVELTITGKHFLLGARVLLNTFECIDTVVISEFEITCTTPALTAGNYNVTVINPSGQSNIIESGYTVSGDN